MNRHHVFKVNVFFQLLLLGSVSSLLYTNLHIHMHSHSRRIIYSDKITPFLSISLCISKSEMRTQVFHKSHRNGIHMTETCFVFGNIVQHRLHSIYIMRTCVMLIFVFNDDIISNRIKNHSKHLFFSFRYFLCSISVSTFAHFHSHHFPYYLLFKYLDPPSKVIV